MAVEAGGAKRAGVGTKVPVPTVHLAKLGFVASNYPVFVFLVGWPHAAWRDKPAGRPADRASPQSLQ